MLPAVVTVIVAGRDIAALAPAALDSLLAQTEPRFRAVLIDRRPEARTDDPVAQMVAALDEGSSLIILPEGKRNMGEAPLEPFKTGLYHLARARPGVDLVPVWIANLNAVMPKGEVIPLPLMCTVTFGAPVRIEDNEAKEAFLARAASALLALREEEA